MIHFKEIEEKELLDSFPMKIEHSKSNCVETIQAELQ